MEEHLPQLHKQVPNPLGVQVRVQLLHDVGRPWQVHVGLCKQEVRLHEEQGPGGAVSVVVQTLPRDGAANLTMAWT